MQKLLTFIFIFSLCNCGITQKGDFSKLCFSDSVTNEIIEVSFEDLYANQNLEGKKVRIGGVLHYYFEDVSICPSKYSPPKESIWLNFSDKIAIFDKQLTKIDGSYIEVIGTVNFSSKGHFSSYIASLNNVYCIKPK
jgi:hypothetical protein